MEILDSFSAPGVAALGEFHELGPKLIEEQRLDDFQNVLFRGVVRALPASLFRMHNGLEQ